MCLMVILEHGNHIFLGGHGRDHNFLGSLVLRVCAYSRDSIYEDGRKSSVLRPWHTVAFDCTSKCYGIVLTVMLNY